MSSNRMQQVFNSAVSRFQEGWKGVNYQEYYSDNFGSPVGQCILGHLHYNTKEISWKEMFYAFDGKRYIVEEKSSINLLAHLECVYMGYFNQLVHLGIGVNQLSNEKLDVKKQNIVLKRLAEYYGLEFNLTKEKELVKETELETT